jgi:hypothetical protein
MIAVRREISAIELRLERDPGFALAVLRPDEPGRPGAGGLTIESDVRGPRE